MISSTGGSAGSPNVSQQSWMPRPTSRSRSPWVGAMALMGETIEVRRSRQRRIRLRTCPPPPPSSASWTRRTAPRACTCTELSEHAARSSWATAQAAASPHPTCSRRPSAALAEHVTVALVEQPYRVAGRRSPAPARQLDAAWIAVVRELLARELRRLPLLVGGRSSGARVACRTAAETGAAGVLCLAFPLRPPARTGAAERPSRLPELEAVTVPDPDRPGRQRPLRHAHRRTRPRSRAGARDHSLRGDRAAVSEAVRAWLARFLPPA